MHTSHGLLIICNLKDDVLKKGDLQRHITQSDLDVFNSTLPKNLDTLIYIDSSD